MAARRVRASPASTVRTDHASARRKAGRSGVGHLRPSLPTRHRPRSAAQVSSAANGHAVSRVRWRMPQGCAASPRPRWRDSSALRKSALPFGSPGCQRRCCGGPVPASPGGGAASSPRGAGGAATEAAGIGGAGAAGGAATGRGSGAAGTTARGCAITRTGSCFASPQAATAAATPARNKPFTAVGSRRTRATPSPRRTPCSCRRSPRCADTTPCSRRPSS